jgi:hypothetical protein
LPSAIQLVLSSLTSGHDVNRINKNKMSIEEINERVREINAEAAKCDNEVAHIKEDNLYKEFIQYVAESPFATATLSDKAEAVLKAQNIQFERWHS